MADELEGKVAIVTGGNAGIGSATALAFGAAGAKVVVAARREAEGQAVVEEIRNAGGEGTFVRTDVAEEADVKALVERTVEIYGRVDCAFNNAGMAGGGSLLECDKATWDEVIAVNLTGVWLCMKYQVPAMLESGGGAIVNCASVLGLVAWGLGGGAYVASKHGVVGMTKSVALEFAQQGIRVNAVCPGWVYTDMTKGFLDDPEDRAWAMDRAPIGRPGAPAEIAGAVLWLCSDAASLTTGIAMPLDGGWTAQ